MIHKKPEWKLRIVVTSELGPGVFRRSSTDGRRTAAFPVKTVDHTSGRGVANTVTNNWQRAECDKCQMSVSDSKCQTS